jgi:hypothetical protein
LCYAPGSSSSKLDRDKSEEDEGWAWGSKGAIRKWIFRVDNDPHARGQWITSIGAKRQIEKRKSFGRAHRRIKSDPTDVSVNLITFYFCYSFWIGKWARGSSRQTRQIWIYQTLSDI